MADDTVNPTAKGLVDVLLVGPVPQGWAEAFELPDTPATAAAGFSVRHLVDDGELSPQLAERLPHVIFTFGEEGDHHRLAEQSIDVRRRWVHLGNGGNPADAARTAMRVFVDVSTHCPWCRCSRRRIASVNEFIGPMHRWWRRPMRTGNG